MRKTMVDVPTDDGTADAYLVRPDGEGSYGGVLMFQDGFGLRPRLKEMALVKYSRLSVQPVTAA